MQKVEIPDKTIIFSVTFFGSGCCYLNKGDCNLHQAKDDSFDEQVSKTIAETIMTTATKFIL